MASHAVTGYHATHLKSTVVHRNTAKTLRYARGAHASHCKGKATSQRQPFEPFAASNADQGNTPAVTSRREAIGFTAAAFALAALELPQPASALGAPGLALPDANGYAVYTRPKAKKGNHGVGWGEIEPYSFKVPEGWEEVGGFAGEGYGGQEVDLRFQSKSDGRLEVVLAPIRRFLDNPGGDTTIKDVGSELKVIKAFGSEITGGIPLEADDVVACKEVTGPKGRPYYHYDLKVGGKDNVLVSATVFNDRAYIVVLKASSLQWRKSKEALYGIRDSFVALE